MGAISKSWDCIGQFRGRCGRAHLRLSSLKAYSPVPDILMSIGQTEWAGALGTFPRHRCTGGRGRKARLEGTSKALGADWTQNTEANRDAQLGS
jgi:hypothetical protein